MSVIEVLLQGEGLRKTEMIPLSNKATIGALIDIARERGIPVSDDLHLFFEEENDDDEGDPAPHGEGRLVKEIVAKVLEELGISNGSCIHLHRRRLIEVTVNYNAGQIKRMFRPAATVGKVLKWSTRKFEIDPTEVTEFGLFLCKEKSVALDEDVHIGRLVLHESPFLCLDLSPKHRVQG